MSDIKRGGAQLAEAVKKAYELGQDDYHLEPMLLVEDGKPVGKISDGDAAIFCCRRGEREIELTEMFTEEGFDKVERRKLNDLDFVIMTMYHDKFKDLPIAFAPAKVVKPLAQVLSEAGKSQFHCAESEKFAHVTFFFNGGENNPFPGGTMGEQNDTHGNTENKDNQYDTDYGVTGDDTLGNENITTAAGVDAEKLSGLSTESKDWGPGGPKDEKNRSQGALLYNKTYGGYNAVFLSEQSEEVYMTFDEGYEYGLSGDILDTLKEKGVKAMFFITGDFAKSEPELVQRMIDEGHVVGNHSWKHPNYSGLSVEEAEQDLMQLHNYMKENFNYEMKYFRFPSGNFSERALAEVQQLGYRSVFWSFAYKDWLTDAQPGEAESLQKIVDSACPGMIYLLHAVSTTNANILGQVIDGVAAKGFTWGDPSKL